MQQELSASTPRLYSLWRIITAGIATFAVPGLQWTVCQIAPVTPYRGWISSILVISCMYLWYRRIETASFLPRITLWRVLVSMGSFVVLGLLVINILNGPVSRITGQARSPWEVVDVLLLVPLAEELIFRGVLWSLFEKLSRSKVTVALAVTSLLFGIEHLGYWAQTYWPLPLAAFLHALSMVGAGLGFGALRWRSRSLAVPIVIHMLANGVILLTQ